MLSMLPVSATFSMCNRLFRILFLMSVVCSGVVFAADDQKPSSPSGIEWHKGPYKAHLGEIAEIEVPKGYMFTDAAGTKRFMELTHNPSGDSELGLLMPVRQEGDSNNDWFILFDFDEIGYVSDSEKSSLNADKILASLQKDTEAGNEFRKQKGWAAFHLSGWQKPPFYDEKFHNLTWATLGYSDDSKEGQTVNYATRLLGRRGTMRVDLVLDPNEMNTAIPIQQQLLSGFTFTQGNRYAEFMKGDKVASYGLTALIAGGAAAAVVKTGLLTKFIALLAAFWKFIVVGFVALGTSIKKFFVGIKNRLSGKNSDQTDYPEQKQIEASVVSSDHDDKH